MFGDKHRLVAKEFNKLFTSVRQTLVGNIAANEKLFQDFFTSHNERMQFEELNFDES